MKPFRMTYCGLLLLLSFDLSAEECVRITSAQGLEAKSGKQGMTYRVEIPTAAKPYVEGTLKYSLAVENQVLVFVFAIPSGAKARTESDDTSLKVCLDSGLIVDPPTKETVLTQPAPPTKEQLPDPPKNKAIPNSTGSSDPAGTSGDDNKLDFASMDLPAPESPAFTVLGLTPENVVRPNSPRELGSTIINGFDQNGNYQTGFALDTTPYLLLAGNSVTLRDYNASLPIRLLSRLQMSVATTKGTTDNDKAVRAALGFRATFWDRGDPRTDQQLIQCFTDKLTIGFPIPPGPTTPEMEKRIAQREVELEAEAEKCREASRKRNWNASSWIVAGAPAWVSPDGQSKNFRLDGGGAWTSLAYGFENIPSLSEHAQLILHVRYRANETVPDPNNKGAYFRQDSTIVGGRIRFGTVDFNGDFEGAYFNNRPVGQKRDEYGRFTFGTEKRLTSNLWLNLSFSSDTGRRIGGSNATFFSNLKWNFSPTPKYQFQAQDK